VIIVPSNQLELTQKQMDEEFTKQLTANNPNAPANIARYNTKEREYKFEPMIDQLVVHFASDGYLLHRESDAAKQQLQLEAMEAEAVEAYEREVAGLPKKKTEGGEEGAEGAEEEASAAADTDESPREPADDSKALRNQFNFSERAAQTVNNPTRERQSATEPPPSQQFTASATQWEMYDAYMEDQLRIAIQKDMMKKQKQREKEAEEAEEAGEPLPKKKDEPVTVPKEKKPEMMAGVPMTRAVKVMERMVNQNSYDDIAQDFKYWEDQSDQFREGEGTLLPLWKFYNERAKRRHVTAIAWNPEYHDLFAVGYGSFDFVKQMSGLIW
jgi:dynein intermediate chain 1